MTASRSSYHLKRFVSAKDPDFTEALQVYIRNTPAAIRTDSNEIAFWLEKCPKDFEGLFYVFGFYRNRQLVGYPETSYFPKARLFAFDYIVIEEAHRRNNVFFEFVDHLQQYLENDQPEYRYAVAEVCYGPGQKFPSEDSQLLSRLLKTQKFRVIRAPYYQPRLSLDDAESEMRADLLVLSSTAIDRIQKETYLQIVRTLYYSYYLPWKSVLPAVNKPYRRYLDGLYSRIQSELGRKQLIVVNGHNVTLAAPVVRPAASLHGTTLAFSGKALAVIVALAATMLTLRAIFHLSDYSLATIFVLALVSFMAVAAVASKDARVVFNQIMSFGKSVFGKRPSGSKPSAVESVSSATDDPDEP